MSGADRVQKKAGSSTRPNSLDQPFPELFDLRVTA
jgi:hypothetical protein